MVAASESEITDRTLSPDDVRTLVAQFEGAFSGLMKPYKRRELVYRVLRRVELSGEKIRLGIDLARREVVESDISPVARSCLDSKTAPGSHYYCSDIPSREVKSPGSRMRARASYIWRCRGEMWRRVIRCTCGADLSVFTRCSTPPTTRQLWATLASHPLGILRWLLAGIYKAIVTETADAG